MTCENVQIACPVPGFHLPLRPCVYTHQRCQGPISLLILASHRTHTQKYQAHHMQSLEFPVLFSNFVARQCCTLYVLGSQLIFHVVNTWHSWFPFIYTIFRNCFNFYLTLHTSICVFPHVGIHSIASSTGLYSRHYKINIFGSYDMC